MTRLELAKQLRLRQLLDSERLSRFLGISEESFTQQVTNLSNEDIIDSYLRCSCCSKYYIVLEKLDDSIKDCKTVDDFFDVLDKGGCPKLSKKVLN